MYNGKYVNRRAGKRRHSKRLGTAVLSLLLLMTVAIGGTVAYLTSDAGSVENTFVPGKVTTEVEEGFDGTVKTNVNARNTGNIDVWVRIKLLTYRVNADGDRIGGKAEIPAFDRGDGWFWKDGFYYYDSPVAPTKAPARNLADKIELTAAYDDADGGKQVIEVMAEAIQAMPDAAVEEAWGVTVSNGKIG